MSTDQYLKKRNSQFAKQEQQLVKQECLSVEQAFTSSYTHGSWSVMYADGNQSKLMTLRLALDYASMFQSNYVIKSRGLFKGLKISTRRRKAK